MGRVRTKTVKRSARLIIEKYYSRMTLDFQTNKKICDEVAVIPTKRLRNKIAGFATHLMKRIQKGPVRGISLKLQEEERERRMDFVPDESAIKTDVIEVDPVTLDMLKAINMATLPGVTLVQPQTGGGGPVGGYGGRSCPDLGLLNTLSPGVYNQTLLRGLDFVLAQARLRGIRVMIAFSNFWGMGDGVNKYIKWAGLNHTDLFFNSTVCQNYYQSYMKMLVSRVNTYNGVSYLNDTTILGWNLLNEPRCFTDGCQDSVQSWTEVMSTYLKKVDPNHLVATGYEGFYGENHNHTSINPGEPWGHWATQTGQEFIRNNKFWAIDFAVAHIWSENWIGNQQNTSAKLSFIQNWITAHNQDARDVLNKPLVWEEFGMQDVTVNGTFTSRNVFLTAIYDALYTSMVEDGTVQGDNVWVFKSPDGEFGYTIRPGQSAAEIVKSHAAAVMHHKHSFGEPC
ncbi:unnamed protein product [Closterium sp. Naga37s-1]|nr:unnamed protein product [Closterium sp. Naga37s-1]